MRDNEVFIALRNELKDRLSLFPSNDLTDVIVKRSYQPTQQAVGEGRIVLISEVSNPQVGGGLSYNGAELTEQKFKRKTFQFTALAQQDINDVTSLTAGDIATISADLLQSYNGLRNLRANGVKVERVTDVRPSYFINDKDRNEMSPSFDLTVQYQHDYTNEIPKVSGVITNEYGV